MRTIDLAERDATQRLRALEKAAYEMSRTIFLNPTHALVSLDDDLNDTRSRENQVRCLGQERLIRKDQRTDTVCDDIFRITIEVSF